MSGPSVLLAGGGTAGHVFPALAVARALEGHGVVPRFVGVEDRLEGRLVPEAGYVLEPIEMVPVPRSLSSELFELPFALRRSVRRCAELVSSEQVVGAVTFGGYVSFPLAWAAWRADIPLVVHEQNSVPGLANRIAARWADRVAATFPGSAERFPHPEEVVVTGNPVRPAILDLDVEARRPQAHERFGLHADRRTLLVFGGSQGARAVNRAIVAAHPLWRRPDQLQILHITGRELHEEALEDWERIEAENDGPHLVTLDFTNEMDDAYAAADVILCRAGATSIAEITALGLPSVLVPYPHATADHQRHNAMALREAAAARVVLDEALGGHTLVDAVEPLLLDEALRTRVAAAARDFGRRDAAEAVARTVVELAGIDPVDPGRSQAHDERSAR